MSSRQEFVGTAPAAGIYEPKPVPPEIDDLSVYINDELLSLGGKLNSVLEGGAFPPQSELPIRWREGMMVYFTQALPDTYPAGPYKGDLVIPETGLWQYKNGKWWKLIDDPTEIEGIALAYKEEADGVTPITPPNSSYPPAGWSKTPPVKTDKTYWIWVVTSTGKVGDDTYQWSIPSPWSSGTIDGKDGTNGKDGANGKTVFMKPYFKEDATTTPPPKPPDDDQNPIGWLETTPLVPTANLWMTMVMNEDGVNKGEFLNPWMTSQVN